MPTKGKGASSKKPGGKSRQQAKPDDQTPAESSIPAEAAESEHAAQTFTRGVIIRGEAARPDEDGDLPSGATHEIVEEDEKGLPVIERRRYSTF